MVDVIAESTLGIAHALSQQPWTCEEHPDKPWPHDDCAGPGMLPALSWPATDAAKTQGCTCPASSPVLAEYGEPPVFECDAWCPLHGLEAILKEKR